MAVKSTKGFLVNDTLIHKKILTVLITCLSWMNVAAEMPNFHSRDPGSSAGKGIFSTNFSCQMASLKVQGWYKFVMGWCIS